MTKITYKLTFAPTTLEQFLRVTWNAVSLAIIVLILSPNKTSLTTLKLCVFFSSYLWAAKELWKMTELLLQEKDLLTIPADQGHSLAGRMVRSLSLEVCKLMCMPICQKLCHEQAKETDFRVVDGLRQRGQFLN